MAMVSPDLSNLDAIYNSDYSYSLPRKVLETFGKGLGFDNKVEYTPEEFGLLMQDIQDIWNRNMASNPENNGQVVMTAGAPGVGKTELIREFWQKQVDGHFAYTCPDDVCLKEMTRTYQEMVKADSSPEGLKKAYTKWRAGSNFAHHLITAYLVLRHSNFYFGTTASSDKTWLFLDFLKKNGYSVTILHVSAPDKVRFDSIAKRDEVFIQTTDQDVLNKQLMVHERIDTFLKYADCIKFYFRTEADKGAIHTATWTRGTPGKLEIIDRKAFDQMRDLHDNVCDGMKKPELKWANTVEKTLK